jgi:hypothetical protein
MKKRILFWSILILLVAVFGLLLIDSHQDHDELIRENLKKYNPPRRDYAIVIDYRKHLFSKRLYLYDLKKGEIILTSRVSHAFNSGFLYASDFSNVNGSEKSCYGAFLTGGSYQGEFGYGMRVKGLEKGINDQAERRAIVFHTANRILPMWSLGCFITPADVNRKLIDLTKGGSLVLVLR